jgi:hypothetical protein
MTDTPPFITVEGSALRDVTALEAFALASAAVTVISQGDPKIAEAITHLAETIFNEIMGISTGQPDIVNADEEEARNDQ